METDTFLITFPNLEIYQTDDLRKWIGIYLHACRSRNLATGTIEFYDKKINTFVQFCLGNNISNISEISADHIRQFLISLKETAADTLYGHLDWHPLQSGPQTPL